MARDTAQLLSAARLLAFEPAEANGGLTDAEVLLLADGELTSYVFPRLLQAHEEYAVVVSDQAVTAGVASYAIHGRAHASRIRDILYVDTAGNSRSLPVIDPDALGTSYTSATTGTPPCVCYLQSSRVYLYPTPSATEGTLRLKYFARPGTLVVTTACAQITAIGAAASGGAGQRRFTCALVPAAWTTEPSMDVVKATGGFETLEMDLTTFDVASGASGTIDVAETSITVANLSVGDWFCLAGESCVPQIPDALHTWLARRTATAILEVRGDANGARLGQAKSDEFETRLQELLQPRVVGEPKVLVPRFSPLRAGGSFGQWNNR